MLSNTAVASLRNSMRSRCLANYNTVIHTRRYLSSSRPVRQIQPNSLPSAGWKFGDGARTSDGDHHKHVEIDPYKEGRSAGANYSLLISGIVPRPIGFISTLGKDKTENLAPFSYFQVMHHDPPIFTVGIAERAGQPKDTLRNLIETGECTINTVSEHMIEAVNATSTDAPHGTSEWKISGLEKEASTTVQPARVRESIFSIEARLSKVVEVETMRKSSGEKFHIAILEGTRFWVRADALDETMSEIDLSVLRPVGQLGGISYARVKDVFDLPRSTWKDDVENGGIELQKLL